MTFPAASPATSIRSEQPFRSGAAQAQTHRLLGDGLIRHVVADVYVARDVPDSMPVRAEAAALLVPPKRRQERSWVVGFASAAWVYTGWWAPVELPGDPDVRAEPCEPRLDLIVSAGRGRPLDPWIRARQGRLHAAEIVVIRGLPISDPVRTAADLAREFPAAAALGMLRRLGELAQVTPDQVLHQLTTMRYARGAARARAVIEAWQEG